MAYGVLVQRPEKESGFREKAKKGKKKKRGREREGRREGDSIQGRDGIVIMGNDQSQLS